MRWCVRWSVIVLCLGCAVEAQAQRILHDATRDTTAQSAVTAAKDITNGSLFDTMLKNVDAQAKLEADTTMAAVEQRMRAQMQTFKVWHSASVKFPDLNPALPLQTRLVLLAGMDCFNSLRCGMERLQRRLTLMLDAPEMTEAQIAARLQAIKDKSAALQQALKELRAQIEKDQSKANDPGVLRALAALEDPGKDIVEYAGKIAAFATSHLKIPSATVKGATQALDEIGSGLDQIIVVYHAVRSIWEGNKAVSVDVASLRPLQEQLDLRLLAVETDYLKALARIQARRHLEVNEALNQVQTALDQMRAQHTYDDKGVLQAGLLIDSTEEIEVTLRNAAKDAQRTGLTWQLQVLHDAAAVIAQMDAAGVLAEMRTGDEKRRYAIRVSTVNASTYDSTIQAAVGRLALYWKGGVKPGDLAQLAFYLTNTIAIPAIAIKQE
jgi:hypothetical protein